MSVVFSGTNQGTFTSTGATQILQIREGVDWINVYNQTNLMNSSPTTPIATQFFWQSGMAQNSMFSFYKSNAADANNLSQYNTTGGFYTVNNTINIPGPSVAITAISNATPPVVSTGNTAGLANGSIVRIYNTTGAQQLGGLDFTIGAVSTNTSFTLAYVSSIAAATAGSYRLIPYDKYWYPPTRVISNISSATQAIVTMTVTHNFTIGQRIRFVIPTVTATAYGTTALNLMEATIVNINQADTNGFTNTITVNIDTTAFGAFAWPLTTDPAHSQPLVVPVGENTAQAITSNTNILGDAEVNLGYIGIALTGGAASPGGANGNVMYWIAGKSYSGGL